MAETIPQQQSLRVKCNTTPSYINPEMWMGVAASLFFSPLLVPIGIAAGSLIGKRRMEEEQESGKVLMPPNWKNREALAGAMVGAAAIPSVAAPTIGFTGLAVSAGLDAFTLATGIGAAGGKAAIAMFAVGTAVTSIVLLSALVGTIALGAWIGSRIGKKRQAKELAECSAGLEAQQVQITRDRQMSPAPQVEIPAPAMSAQPAQQPSWAERMALQAAKPALNGRNA